MILFILKLFPVVMRDFFRQTLFLLIRLTTFIVIDGLLLLSLIILLLLLIYTCYRLAIPLIAPLLFHSFFIYLSIEIVINIYDLFKLLLQIYSVF